MRQLLLPTPLQPDAIVLLLYVHAARDAVVRVEVQDMAAIDVTLTQVRRTAQVTLPEDVRAEDGWFTRKGV